MTDKSLLDAEDDDFLQKLLLKKSGSDEFPEIGDLGKIPLPFAVVKPEPGVCIKTKDNKGEKVFINICKSSQMPSPKDISEDELVKLLEEDMPDYRIPMSIGEPHAELDKSGYGCTAYDIMISDEFYTKVLNSHIFNGFFMSVIFEAIQNKFNILIDKKWTQLKNRKALGNLHEHHIRPKSKPQILEMPSTLDYTPKDISTTSTSLITEVEGSEVKSEEQHLIGHKGEEPEFVILREPMEGHPEFLVAEIKLPKVKSCRTVDLDLGEDRILLKAHPDIYLLDIYIPYDVVQEDSGAQFNADNKILTLTLSVKQT